MNVGDTRVFRYNADVELVEDKKYGSSKMIDISTGLPIVNVANEKSKNYIYLKKGRYKITMVDAKCRVFKEEITLLDDMGVYFYISKNTLWNDGSCDVRRIKGLYDSQTSKNSILSLDDYFTVVDSGTSFLTTVGQGKTYSNEDLDDTNVSNYARITCLSLNDEMKSFNNTYLDKIVKSENIRLELSYYS